MARFPFLPTILLIALVLPACSTRRGEHHTSLSPENVPIATDGPVPVPSTSLAAMGRRPDPSPALYIPGKETPGEEILPVPPPSITFRATPPEIPPSLPPLPPGPDPPVAPPLPPASETPLRDVYTKALKRHETMDTYMMRLRRREVVGGSARPEEIMLCKVRKEPFSVYFKWLGSEGKGREVTFVKGQHGNLIHSLTATGDVLFLPGGKRFKVAPDSILVKSKTRHPITEAGMGPLVRRFGRLVDAVEKGDSREGSAKYLGELKRPEFENRVIGVQQTIPLMSDPLLPKGGQRLWFFDPSLGLPVLVITHDETGREVEFYCHDRFLIPGNLTDTDFNPDELWKAEK